MMSVVIVGAGMTGLTAAYFLSREGGKCLLLEKEKDIGGLCRSYKLDDIIFDLGPHLFFNNPDFEAERFMMEILKDEKFIKKRFRFAIYNKGRYWKFPLSIFDMLFYPLDYKKHFLLSLMYKNNDSPENKISVEQDIIEKGGRSYYERVFAPMLLKKSLLPGNKIHRDWLARVDRDVENRKEPFKEISHGGLLRKILSTLYQYYYYPFNGFERFPQKLWERYKEAGGETIVNCGPIKFEEMGNKITKVTIRDKTYPLKNVIWTGSINSLNEILGKDIQKLKYVKAIIVLLTYNQKNPIRRPFIYVYYPDKNLIFNRIYYPANIYKDQTPSGREGICLELNYLDYLDNMTDDEIILRAVGDIEKEGLFKRSDLRRKRVVRLGECLPVYNLDYENKMEETFKVVHFYDNLYSVGRLGGYFFCMTPLSVRQGIKIARRILQNV